jgi:hypothetical protein
VVISTVKLKLMTKDEERKVYIEWAAPEDAKTVIADEKGMLRIKKVNDDDE